MAAIGIVQERVKPADRLDESYLIRKTDIVEGATLGSGGFGVVRKGTYDGTDVAIKYLAPEGREISIRDLRDLKKEARRLIEASDHPYIINIHGAVFDNGMNAIILEYMQFGNAAKFLEHYEVELALKMQMVCQICSAMEWLHSRVPPVKHLDLKAENVLINNYFDAKLCDFGLSHLKTQTVTLELENSRRGTHTHVAPEVLKDINVKPSTEQDVYAFAITTWEILSGKSAYAGQNREAVLMCVKIGQRPDLRELPADVPQCIRSMIAKCWDQFPTERPTFKNLYPDLNNLYLDRFKSGVLSACRNIRTEICNKYVEDRDHYQEEYECTYHFDLPATPPATTPECDTARSIIRDHSVDAHPTLDEPALDFTAGLAGQQRVTDQQGGDNNIEVVGIGRLTIHDDQEVQNENFDVTQHTPAVAAVQYGVAATPDAGGAQHDANVMPKIRMRSGPVVDDTPVPPPRNTRPGVWSNLDEASLQLRNQLYPVQRNTTDNIERTILGQPVPYERVVQPEILGQSAPRPIVQTRHLGMSTSLPAQAYQRPLDSHVSVDQDPSDASPRGQAPRSNSHSPGISERDNVEMARDYGGTAIPVMISHKHAGGSFTQIQFHPDCKIRPNIQIGNNNKMVVHENGNQKKEKRRKSSSKKCDMNLLTTSEAPLTPSQVDILAAGLGKDWKTLCRLKLSLADPEIEQLEHDYQVAGLYEITYQAIRRWQQKQGSNATQRKMALYLWEIDRDDLAQQI